jgi:hypothetical protein
VITVTVRFDDADTGEPTGLTVVILKPELFRVTIDTNEAPVGAPLLVLPRGSGNLPGHVRVPPGTLEPRCRLRS